MQDGKNPYNLFIHSVNQKNDWRCRATYVGPRKIARGAVTADNACELMQLTLQKNDPARDGRQPGPVDLSVQFSGLACLDNFGGINGLGAKTSVGVEPPLSIHM